ncbi:MAG: fumarylacetoacetate hydrolase family protein [Hyphomonadaceae bacterium]|nr:fumarylacetoacetate hydrolase family protein [Hyphomonadaceae bacterium]
MKLVRFGMRGAEKPGLVAADGTLRDLSQHVRDVTPDVLDESRLAQLARLDHGRLPAVAGDVRLGAPLAQVGKIVCAGLNYRDHALEAGMSIPDEPILFMKAVTALSGPNDPVTLPPGAEKTDWEVELAVVIGRVARRVPVSAALDHVAGYCVANDISERAYQLEHGGQWVKGKSYDNFAPLGPWLVTRDEAGSVAERSLWLEVNGCRLQDGNTRDLIFAVPWLVSYISRYMTLNPGDLILTGTPSGVGLGQKPPVFLKSGDVMRLGIEGLGEQRQEVRGDDSPDLAPAARVELDA